MQPVQCLDTWNLPFAICCVISLLFALVGYYGHPRYPVIIRSFISTASSWAVEHRPVITQAVLEQTRSWPNGVQIQQCPGGARAVQASTWQNAGRHPENKSWLLNRSKAPKSFLATSRVKVGKTVVELFQYKVQFVQYIVGIQLFSCDFGLTPN